MADTVNQISLLLVDRAGIYSACVVHRENVSFRKPWADVLVRAETSPQPEFKDEAGHLLSWDTPFVTKFSQAPSEPFVDLRFR